MPTNVLMPQMGESIAEGTIVRWVKKVGDRVDRDEPLFEISTDKVDAEIPSPAAGVLIEIRAKEGETVAVNHIVAVIGDAVAAAAPAPAPAAAAAPAQAKEVAAAPAPVPPRRTRRRPRSCAGRSPRPSCGRSRRSTASTSRRLKAPAREAASPSRTSWATWRRSPRPRPRHAAPPIPRMARDEVVPMTVMRRKIAEHMIASRRTSAHVHSVFEIDFSRVAKLRDAKKAEYERAGAKLTYLPFIVKAVVDGLRAVPVVNTSIDGTNIIYHKDINIGIAVALDWGLIVPVVKQADELSVLGLSRAMQDLADRARSKHLKPEEVQGGTFTITNPGVFGALLGMAVISQPQVAILGIGAIEKRVVVVDDAIAIRPMAYLTLGYDHRLIDGAVADQFMSVVKKQIETFDPAAL